ncbi:hypothetical protein EMCRGX_G033641 [Ephydatia muelleri]
MEQGCRSAARGQPKDVHRMSGHPGRVTEMLWDTYRASMGETTTKPIRWREVRRKEEGKRGEKRTEEAHRGTQFSGGTAQGHSKRTDTALTYTGHKTVKARRELATERKKDKDKEERAEADRFDTSALPRQKVLESQPQDHPGVKRSTVPIWQPLYIDNRSSALGLNPTPGQGTPICDGSRQLRCTLPSTPEEATEVERKTGKSWTVIDYHGADSSDDCSDIEFSTKNCDGCRLVKYDPKLTPVHPWEFPEGLWSKVHIDFAGPFEGKQFLVAVDAYSKWPEVVIMEDTSTEKTLDELRAMFARWGIPQQIVSDSSRLTNLNSLSERTTRRHADEMVPGSTDSWWRNDGDRVEIIDSDHGPEPDVETRTQPGGNCEGHTHVKPSKESREEVPETRPELQGPGQVESSSKGNTNPEAMSEKVTTSVTLTDELQQTCPEKIQAKSKEVTASPLMEELQRTHSGRVVKPPKTFGDESH